MTGPGDAYPRDGQPADGTPAGPGPEHDGLVQPERTGILGITLSRWGFLRASAVGAAVVSGYIAGEWDPTEDTAEKPWLSAESLEVTIPWMPDTVKRWQPIISEMAAKYNVDANYAAIILLLESGGHSKADSGPPASALGLMQITAGTAGDIAAKHLKKPVTEYNIWDPRTNIEFGIAFIAYLRGEFSVGNDVYGEDATAEMVAAGYNGGAGAANKIYTRKGLDSNQTIGYSRNVEKMWIERGEDHCQHFDNWYDNGGYKLIDKAKAEMGS